MRTAVAAFALGVLLLQCQPVLPSWAPWLALAVVLLPLAGRPGMAPRLLVAIAGLALGFAWAAWRAELRLADALAVELEGSDIELVGVVAGLPQSFAYGERFEFDVFSASTAAGGVPGRVSLSWYRNGPEGSPVLRPGERWRLTARLKLPHGNANPGGFDYEAWLLERGIRATGYVRPVPAERQADMVWRPAYVVERLRHAIRASFAARLPAEDYPWGGVLVALAIGDQRAVDGELWNIFNRTGTTHLMSISGLHVTMVAALAGWLVAWLWRRSPVLAGRWPAQKAGIVAAVFAAWAYALLAGFAVPAQRTLIMLALAALSLLSGRGIAPSRVLAIALLAVLLLDPWAVLAAGFWLSFGAVAALLYAGSATTGETPGWRGRIARWGAVQWTATLASLPVLLLLFQQFSLVSPLANAVAIPVISFLVTPLALLGAVVPWWPVLWLAHAVMAGLMLFLNWCAAWPVWQVPAPPVWAAVAAAAGVAVCLLPRGVPGRVLGFLMLLPALWWPAARPPEGEAIIDVLDVGQGLATVVRTREHTLIYDPGPLYGDSDAGQRVVVPYLRWLGADRVDRLVVTHRDTDHSGGTASLRAALPVGDIRSSVPGLGGEPCRAGQKWRWDGVDFAFLHPAEPAAVDGKTNHFSCVLRIAAGERVALLTSDIEAEDEAALVRRDPGALRAHVMLVPHHGSRTSSTPEFLAAVGAVEAIVPVGYRNRFGHPKAEVLARYEAGGTRLWRTDRDGAVAIRLAPGSVELAAWRQQRQRYWHGQ